MSVAVAGRGAMKPVYELQGHTGSILCCATSGTSPDEVVTSSEDGTVRVFDLRSRSCSMRIQSFGGQAVNSVSLNPEHGTELYVAAGAVVYCVELRLGSAARELQRYDFNLDEINQVVVNQKGTYVAAADDTGEIKVIDVHNRTLYRTLRGVHTNIGDRRHELATAFFQPMDDHDCPDRYAVQCSFILKNHGKVAHIAVISGGLDSKIVKWDFSKGKDVRSLDLAVGCAHSIGQLCNPPFVHALAIPDGDGSGEIGRLVAVARGDGAVEVYDLSFGNDKTKGWKNRRGKHRSISSQGVASAGKSVGPASRGNGIRCHLDSQHGGHLAAVSSVCFARFGEKGEYVLSGGNDKFVKVWNWRRSTQENQSEDREALVLDIQHGKKVNWLSTIDKGCGNLVVADTSEVLSVYHIF